MNRNADQISWASYDSGKLNLCNIWVFIDFRPSQTNRFTQRSSFWCYNSDCQYIVVAKWIIWMLGICEWILSEFA